MQGGPVKAAQGRKRLKPGRYLGRAVGVHGPGTAVVASVERSEQIHDFRSPDFSDDQSVGTHSQCLTNQLPQGDLSCAFDICAAGDQPDEVRMFGCQLRCILDTDNPLMAGNRPQCCRQQGRLTRAGATGYQKRQPRRNDVGQQLRGRGVDRSRCCQRREILCCRAQHPQRQAGAGHRNRGQDRMQPHGELSSPHPGELAVHPGLGIVESTPGSSGESLRQPAYSGLIRETNLTALQPVSIIHPHRIRSGHQNIRGSRGTH